MCNGIPFSIDPLLNKPNHTIVIEKPARLAGNTMDVYINFLSGEYHLTFQRAGGLCIINNLDGGDPVDPTVVFTEPIKLLDNSNGTPEWSAFIPSTMTSDP